MLLGSFRLPWQEPQVNKDDANINVPEHIPRAISVSRSFTSLNSNAVAQDMEGADVKEVSSPQRPSHRRNPSSKSAILRALVPSKLQATSDDTSNAMKSTGATQKVLLAPADRGSPLQERQYNAQSPSASPSKPRHKSMAVSKTSHDLKQGTHSRSKSKYETKEPKKSKSSTNLGAVFAKMNRSSKDLSPQKPKDKENKTPPTSSHGTAETPIWAQFATTAKPELHTSSSGTHSFEDDEAPKLRVPAARRPQSEQMSNFARLKGDGKFSRDGAVLSGRKSEDNGDQFFRAGRNSTERKISGSSSEQAPLKDRLTIAKRGGRVMAAVAAWQGKSKEEAPKEEPALDPEVVDRDFEAVLTSRNVPEPMRQKMRSLTLHVKADFVKQHRAGTSASGTNVVDFASSNDSTITKESSSTMVDEEHGEQQSTSTKRSRSRPRSRTFTFSKGDKNRGDQSPSKKQRSQSRGRSTTTQAPKDTNTSETSSPKKHTGSLGRLSQAPKVPADFISYLRKHQEPAQVEIGRVHKLRILLRNETVAWVDSFISLGGMNEVVGLLHRIMQVEWREEHEDQLLHETLLCLKGLCTTERAMTELAKVADELFPALLTMLYDDEKKGPAEYSTRTIITNVLFNYLQSALNSSPNALSDRAQRILTYMGEPTKPDSAQPVDFVLGMQIPRPYRLWSRELSNVTREVFWIFLHHLNVIPSPRPDTSSSSSSDADRAAVLTATYTTRHFPGTRPPVPAAPYIGGVEWDATTYLTSHLDLLNGLLASLPTAAQRNSLRSEMRESGFEKTMGTTLRTCKEKFYSGVHDGLKGWVGAAEEDGWDTGFVREGPTLEEQANRARSLSPKKSPNKKKKKDGEGEGVDEKAPQLGEVKLEMPRLDFGVDAAAGGQKDKDEDDGWLG